MSKFGITRRLAWENARSSANDVKPNLLSILRSIQKTFLCGAFPEMNHRLLLLVILSLITANGFAAEFTVGNLTVKNPWSRPTPPVASAGAAYFVLDNSQGQDDRLLSAEADISARVELHTHLMDGDVMMMRKLDTIEVPAEQTIAFEPRGLHIMFIGLEGPLVEGETFPLTLNFEQAGAVTVEVAIGQQPNAK